MNVVKNIVAGLILISLCAYSTYREMQTLAIVSIILLIGMMYRRHVLRGLELLFDIARSAKQAKFGNFELEIGKDKVVNHLINHIEPNKEWAKSIIRQLDGKHIGLILTINKEKKYLHLSGVKDKLRDLRSRGLLNHNKDTMEASSEVWLTELGVEIADIISQASTKSKLEQQTHN